MTLNRVLVTVSLSGISRGFMVMRGRENKDQPEQRVSDQEKVW
jgi:hypothetical protein